MSLLISFRVTSLALGQSHDCPSASEVTLKDRRNVEQNQTTTKHNKVLTERIIFGLYVIIVIQCRIA